jgi:hypothetical protein
MIFFDEFIKILILGHALAVKSKRSLSKDCKKSAFEEIYDIMHYRVNVWYFIRTEVFFFFLIHMCKYLFVVLKLSTKTIRVMPKGK